MFLFNIQNLKMFLLEAGLSLGSSYGLAADTAPKKTVKRFDMKLLVLSASFSFSSFPESVSPILATKADRFFGRPTARKITNLNNWQRKLGEPSGFEGVPVSFSSPRKVHWESCWARVPLEMCRLTCWVRSKAIEKAFP